MSPVAAKGGFLLPPLCSYFASARLKTWHILLSIQSEPYPWPDLYRRIDICCMSTFSTSKPWRDLPRWNIKTWLYRTNRPGETQDKGLVSPFPWLCKWKHLPCSIHQHKKTFYKKTTLKWGAFCAVSKPFHLFICFKCKPFKSLEINPLNSCLHGYKLPSIECVLTLSSLMLTLAALKKPPPQKICKLKPNVETLTGRCLENSQVLPPAFFEASFISCSSANIVASKDWQCLRYTKGLTGGLSRSFRVTLQTNWVHMAAHEITT